MKCLRQLLWVLVLAPPVAGCSATKKLAADASSIGKFANAIEKEAALATAAHEEGADPRPFHKAIASKAAKIRDLATGIQETLPDVKDRESQWMSLLRLGLIVAGIVAVLILLIYLGVGKLLKPLANRLGLWIGQKTKASATLDAKVLKGQATPAEAVAARRASDPTYNQAFQQADAKLEGAAT